MTAAPSRQRTKLCRVQSIGHHQHALAPPGCRRQFEHQEARPLHITGQLQRPGHPRTGSQTDVPGRLRNQGTGRLEVCQAYPPCQPNHRQPRRTRCEPDTKARCRNQPDCASGCANKTGLQVFQTLRTGQPKPHVGVGSTCAHVGNAQIRLKISVPLVPPKPNEFDMAYSISILRAVLAQ